MIRKHLLTLLCVAVWGLLAPASWLGSLHAQGPTNPIPITDGVLIDRTGGDMSPNPGLSPNDYTGNAAAINMLPPGYSGAGSNGKGPLFGGQAPDGGMWQQWYSLNVPLSDVGKTFLVDMRCFINGWFWGIVSVQDPSDFQIAWKDAENVYWPDGSWSTIVAFTPNAAGQYKIICATWPYGGNGTQPPGPGGIAPPFPYTVRVMGNPPLTDLFVGTPVAGNLSPASYYGGAAASSNNAPMPQHFFEGNAWWTPFVFNGSPQPWPQSGGFGAGAPSQFLPKWCGYYQNWYKVTMEPGKKYGISMSIPATFGTQSPIVSIQDSLGNQVGYFYTQGQQVSVEWIVPGAGPPDVYYIICACDQTGSPWDDWSGYVDILELDPTGFTLAVADLSAPQPTFITFPLAKTYAIPTVNVPVKVSVAFGVPTGDVLLSVDYGPPTGIVNFGPVALDANGTATFPVNNITVGSRPLVATFTSSSTSYSNNPGQNGTLPVTAPITILDGQTIFKNSLGVRPAGGYVNPPPHDPNQGFGPNSYIGPGAAKDIMPAGYSGGWQNTAGPLLDGLWQEWYVVDVPPADVGKNYFVELHMLYTPNYWGVLSIQDPVTGKQIAWKDAPNAYWEKSVNDDWSNFIVFTVVNPGPHIIVAAAYPGGGNGGNTSTPYPYSLTVFCKAPNPTATLTVGTPLPNEKLNPSSYYGPAAASTLLAGMAAPQPRFFLEGNAWWTPGFWPQSGGWGPSGAPDNLPNWCGYYQNWYTVSLTAGVQYGVGMSIPATFGMGSIVSIQDPFGNQEFYFYTAGQPVEETFTPSQTGNYTIICACDQFTFNYWGGYAESLEDEDTPFSITVIDVSIAQATTISFPLASTYATTTVPVPVKVSAGFGKPTGSVTLTADYGPPLGIVNCGTVNLVNGTATFSLSNPPAGVRNLAASYTATGLFNDSTGTGTVQLNDPTPIFDGIMIDKTTSGGLAPTDYTGPAAATNMMPSGYSGASSNGKGPLFGGFGTGGIWQQWYAFDVTLLDVGKTYLVDMRCFIYGWFWGIVSVQGPDNKQIAWKDAENVPWSDGQSWSTIVPFIPTQQGKHIIICATYEYGGNGSGFPGPGGIAPPFPYTVIVRGNAPIPATITLGSPTTGQSLSSSSYYGAAAVSTMGAPTPQLFFEGNGWWTPALGQNQWPQSGGWGPGGTNANLPNWCGYFQNWYTVGMTNGTYYQIDMTIPATFMLNPIVSVQDPNGLQVGYFGPGSPLPWVFTPPGGSPSGPYTIICASDQSGDPWDNWGGYADQFDVTPTDFTLLVSQLQVGATATTVTATNPPPLSPTTAVNVTVTALTGGGPPTGNVTFSVDNGPPSLPVPLINGAASSTVPTPTTGTIHNVKATYIPTGGGFLTSTSDPFTFLVVPVTIVSSVPYTKTGVLDSSSYMGNAAGGQLQGGYNGVYQDWYSVQLGAGKTYVFTMWNTGGSFRSRMSLQDSSGQQLTYERGPTAGTFGILAQIHWNPTVSGTYYLIVVNDYNTPGNTNPYKLTIPTPTPQLVTPITTIPYSSPGHTITPSSYYGRAGGQVTTPPPPTLHSAGQTHGMQIPQPPWVQYYQNWYSVYMSQGTAYTATMTGTGSIRLSIQDSSGVQLQHNTGAGSAQISFVAPATGTYTIICAKGNAGPPAPSLTFNLQVSTNFTLNGIPNVRLAPPKRDRLLWNDTFALGAHVDSHRDSPIIGPAETARPPVWLARRDKLIV